LDTNPVNPAHYQKAGGIETIDYIEAVTADIPGDEAVSLANVIKYVSRYRQKHPKDPVRDLKKARWYLDRLINLVTEKERDARETAEDAPEASKMTSKPKAIAKNRKEDEEANAAVFQTNTPRPGDVPGSRDRKKSDTDGWRDDYSNKGPNLKYPCGECGSEPGRKHHMSCSEYTGHF
jgi:hypothetical protein